MRIGRWSELSVDSDNETSGELGSALGGTLVGVFQLRIPWSDPLIESAIFLPLVSVDPEYQDGWCALKSPRIRLSFVVIRCSIEDTHCCMSWLGESRCWRGSYSDFADDGCLEKVTDLWMKISSPPP